MRHVCFAKYNYETGCLCDSLDDEGVSFRNAHASAPTYISIDRLPRGIRIDRFSRMCMYMYPLRSVQEVVSFEAVIVAVEQWGFGHTVLRFLVAEHEQMLKQRKSENRQP